jgi:hypothetical protein
LADPLTLPFFNGQKPAGSTDFTKSTSAAASLSGKLIRFFAGALGCTDGTVAPYVEGQKKKKCSRGFVSCVYSSTYGNYKTSFRSI